MCLSGALGRVCSEKDRSVNSRGGVNREAAWVCSRAGEQCVSLGVVHGVICESLSSNAGCPFQHAHRPGAPGDGVVSGDVVKPGWTVLPL